MYQEKRPTCVTVIGWAWIIIGGLMLFGSVMALIGSSMMTQLAQSDEPAPFFIKIFPSIAIIEMGFGILGIVSGIHFLKLKASARSALELLTWLLLILILGFMVFWFFNWLTFPSQNSPPGFRIMGIVMGVINTAIFAVPLIIMLKYLRGRKVKDAIKSAAEPPVSGAS